MGQSCPGAAQTFRRPRPLDPVNLQPRQGQTRAGAAAGNENFSEKVTLTPAAPLPGLMAFGLDRKPAPRGLIGQRADGSLTPYVYVPSHRASLVPDASPQWGGAKPLEQDGQTYIEFHSLEFRFGENSAIQIEGTAPGAGAGGAAVGLLAAAVVAVARPRAVPPTHG